MSKVEGVSPALIERAGVGSHYLNSARQSSTLPNDVQKVIRKTKTLKLLSNSALPSYGAIVSIEEDFEIHILDQHRISREETGYRAPAFRSMVSERGALQTARDLLVGPNRISEGLTTLVLHNRLDLSLEANVIKPEWRQLFTLEELRIAVRRLRELNYQIEPDIDSYIQNESKPKRRSYETNQIIRDQGLPLEVKRMYDHRCQMCGTRLEAGNYWYAEAAHIKALGNLITVMMKFVTFFVYALIIISFSISEAYSSMIICT